MELQTNRNVDDTVWFIQNNKVETGKIVAVKTFTNTEGTTESYNIETGGKPESKNIQKVFDTKEELLASL